MSNDLERRRKIWAEDELVSVFLGDQNDSDVMRKSILIAILIHVVLLAIQFPSFASNWGERDENVVVYQVTPYVPPPRNDIERQIQQVEKVKKVPLPDPTPDEPEPIREPDPEPEPPPIPPNATVLFGIPKGPPAAGPVRAGSGGVAPLKTLKKVQAEYPILAKRAEVEGLVVLDVLVDVNGRASDIKVLKPLPMGLSEAAVDAVKQWEFEPANQFGRKVPAWMTVKVQFSLGS